MPIYSNQVEGHVLGGLLKHPDVLPEVDSFVNAADFYNDVHQTIYCILRESILNGEKIDKVLSCYQNIQSWEFLRKMILIFMITSIR